jgi:hypothetical protein
MVSNGCGMTRHLTSTTTDLGAWKMTEKKSISDSIFDAMMQSVDIDGKFNAELFNTLVMRDGHPRANFDETLDPKRPMDVEND